MKNSRIVTFLSFGLIFASASLSAGCGEPAQSGKLGAPAKASAPKPDAPQHTMVAAPKPLEITNQIVNDQGAVVATLSNGLTVIVKPHRAAPVVSVRCYVHAGSLYEREWLGCGLSHLVEHLVANGAEGGPSAHEGQTSSGSRIGKIGGQYNASTGQEVTNYYISASNSKTMDCIDLVAEWMAHPDFTRTDFEREHGVVQRELEMGKDSPMRALYYAHADNLYGDHPAAVEVIGLPGPLARLTYEDVRTYHARMYIPQNMVFCVVGDIDTAAVLERVRKDFAGFDAQRVPDYTLPEVKPITSTRRIVQPVGRINQAMEMLSFQTISMMDKDLYALDVLATILGEGPGSYLDETLRQKQRLATAINCSSDTPVWGKGELTVFFRTMPDKAQAAEDAVLAVLKDVVAKGVSEDDLKFAKRQKLSELVQSRQSVDSIAAVLASDYLLAHDVNFSTDYLKRIEAVTAAQVQAAAAKYIQFDRMVVTRLVPEKGFSMTQATTQSAAETKAEVFTLPNGLKVILKPVAGTGVASMVLVTRGGEMLETPANNGIGNMMAYLSTRNPGGRTGEEVDRFFALAGGSLAGSGGYNSFTWTATVLDDSFDKALVVFADAACRPKFTQDEFDAFRPVALAAIDNVEEDWQAQLVKNFRKQFFQDRPYSMLPSGAKDVINKLTPEQLADYHRKYVKAGDSVLAVYGSFDPKSARTKIEELFAAMPQGKNDLPKVTQRIVNGPFEFNVVKTKNQQAAIAVGLPSLTVADVDDRMPLDVLDTIISGWAMPGGWLHDELRGKQLVYVVHAFSVMGMAPGTFLTMAGTQPDKADEVVAIIRKNLAKAAIYKPTQQEIDDAVNTILTYEALENQSMSSLATQAALDELYGLGHDFSTKMADRYRKVTPEDVLRIGKKYFNQGTVITVTTPQPELVNKPAK